MARKYRIFLISLLVSVGLDQASKWWARASLKPRFPDVVTVIPGYWEFRYAENTGAAFSLFRDLPGGRWLLLAVAIVAFVVIFGYVRKAAPDAWRLAAELGLVAGGALGNILDRVAFGRVTDFVVWKVGTHEWPTFNVADAALLVGIAGLLFEPQQKKKPAPATQPDDRADKRKRRASEKR